MSNQENTVLYIDDSSSDEEYSEIFKHKEQEKEQKSEQDKTQEKKTYTKRIYETNPDYMYYQKVFYYKRKYINDIWAQSLFNNPKLTNKDIYEKMKVYNEYRCFKQKLKKEIAKMKQHNETS